MTPSTFTLGDAVRVIDGPFADFTALVREVAPDGARLKVDVTMLGRPVPIDVERWQVEARRD